MPPSKWDDDSCSQLHDVELQKLADEEPPALSCPSSGPASLRLSAAPFYEITDDDESTSPKKSSDVKSNSNSNLKAVGACLLYSFCSVSMILVNKSLASSYNHLIDGSLNILLVVFQACIIVICVEVCRRLKLVEYPPLTLQTVRAWAPVNIFFCLMLITGMASLEMNSVPMVTVFKNVTNILTATGDYIFFGNKPECLTMAALRIMLLGAASAARNDANITFSGVFWIIANCFSTAGYILYMKHAIKTIQLSKFGMVYVNNILCVAFLSPIAWYNDEVRLFANSPAIHTVDYIAKNIFAGFVGFFLNFASLNCVAATGPTTFAIMGSVNKIPVAILGWLLFNSMITRKTWFFIAISMLGGFLYSYAKIRSSFQRNNHR